MSVNRFPMSGCTLYEARYNIASTDLSSSGTYTLVNAIAGKRLRLLSVVLRTSAAAEVAITDDEGNGVVGDSTFTISLDATDAPLFSITRATGIASLPSGSACMLYASRLDGQLEILVQYTIHDADDDVVA